MLCKQRNVLLSNEMRKCIRSCFQIVETTFLSFFNPFVCISVSVKDDAFMLFNGLLKKCMYCAFHFFFRNILKSCAEFCKNLCNSGIQYDVRVCDRCCRTKHTELKFVSGKCKW